jgi:hypothetical protein
MSYEVFENEHINPEIEHFLSQGVNLSFYKHLNINFLFCLA